MKELISKEMFFHRSALSLFLLFTSRAAALLRQRSAAARGDPSQSELPFFLCLRAAQRLSPGGTRQSATLPFSETARSLGVAQDMDLSDKSHLARCAGGNGGLAMPPYPSLLFFTYGISVLAIQARKRAAPTKLPAPKKAQAAFTAPKIFLKAWKKLLTKWQKLCYNETTKKNPCGKPTGIRLKQQPLTEAFTSHIHCNRYLQRTDADVINSHSCE